MSIVGTQQVVNTNTPPLWVSLNSAKGESNGSQLSEVIFDVDNAIVTPDSNFAAVLSIHSMSFFNSFNNITPKNNKLTYISTYMVAGGAIEYAETDVFILPDYYTAADANVVLNATQEAAGLGGKNGLLSHKDAAGYAYGMGHIAVSGGLGAYVYTVTAPFSVAANNRRFLLHATPAASLDPVVAAHRYIGFYLAVNDSTLPMLRKLGFGNTGSNNAFLDAKIITEISPLPDTSTNLYGIGFKYDNDGVNYTRASGYPAQIQSPNFLNMNTVLSLDIRVESMHTAVRTGVGLRAGDTVGIVPVTGGFGTRSFFEASNPMSSIMTNLNMSRLKITIRDATDGHLVDFNAVNWILNLKFDFMEISNGYNSQSGSDGVGQKVLPIFHHESARHFDAHSGMKKSRLT